MPRWVVLVSFLGVAACAPARPLPHAPERRLAPVRAAPAAVAPAPAPAPTPSATSGSGPAYAWVLPVDHGWRADRGGGGGFLAPRAHGSHNGIDLLAPLGTPVLAPCPGVARGGENSSHGKWAQLVCPLPAALGLDPSRRVSFFFAHLSRVAVAGDAWASVAVGAELGGVGKTGNASSSIIAPHLHFEALVLDDEETARSERHSGRDQSDSRAAHELDGAMRTRCLEPNALEPRGQAWWRARRADPFVLLTCLGAKKPAFTRPRGKLGEASHPWSEAYSATGFDVDAGTPGER